MAYNDAKGFVDSHSNQKDFNEKFIDSDPGPFVGVVRPTWTH